MTEMDQEVSANEPTEQSLVLPLVIIILLAAIGSAGMAWYIVTTRKNSAPADAQTTFQPASLDRPVPDFKLINQDGKEVTLADLKGKIWIASFIFTRCHSSCPTVSATMARLRDELPKDVQLVSFSVDPRHDTPEVLATYAKHFQANSTDWSFLTGDREQIYRVSKDGFLLAVEENPDPRVDPGDLVIHSNRIVLVDPTGMARTTYNCMEPSTVDLVKSAVEKMQQK